MKTVSIFSYFVDIISSLFSVGGEDAPKLFLQSPVGVVGGVWAYENNIGYFILLKILKILSRHCAS